MDSPSITVRMDYAPDGSGTLSYITEVGETPPFFVTIAVKLPKKKRRTLTLYYGTHNNHPYAQITAPHKDGACLGCITHALKESYTLVVALLQDKGKNHGL